MPKFTNKPTKPGLYWLRRTWRGKPFGNVRPGDTDPGEIVHVDDKGWISHVDVGGMNCDDLDELMDDKDLETQWYGPLTSPWEDDDAEEMP